MRSVTAARTSPRVPRPFVRFPVAARKLRRCTLALGLACAIALPALPASALPGDETLLLDLCINDRCVGVAPVIARGDDVLIDRLALEVAGIDTRDVIPEHLGERDFVSIRQLNHGSKFAIDRTLLRLDLTLRADRLPRQTATLTERTREAQTAPQPWTAFVNYAATAGEHDDRQFYLDAAVGRGNAAFRTTGSWNSFESWQRGLTRFELDQPHALRRWTVGDQYALARDPLAGGLLIGGVGVERAFDEDPYLVTFPQPYYSGVLESPGTVEVYANGVLIGRRDLGAGPFTLQSLGIQPGRNDVRVIMRDAFGNRSELATQSYYGGSPRLLAKGLDEYAVRLGAPRENGGIGGGYLDDTTYQAWYRRGLSDWFTLGGRIEGSDDVRNAGLDVAFSTPIGEFALAAAASEHDFVGRGDAWGANYSYTTRSWSAGLGTRRASADYRNLTDPSPLLLGPIRQEDYASLSFSPAERLTLQLNAGRVERALFPAERSAGLTASYRLWDRGQLFFVVQRRESDFFEDTTAQLNLNIALDRDSITLSAHSDDRGGETHGGVGLDARRSRPSDTGFGYSVNVQHAGDFDAGYGQLEYQARHARFLLEADKYDSADVHVRGTASGALVAVGGRVFATPPLDTGFALVRVPGVAGVPILRENQVVGYTDANGDLLVRELLPFHANKLALDPAAVPAGYDLREPVRHVQVSRNTGSLVVLETTSVHAITGHFRYAGGAAGDLVRIGDAQDGTPIGTDGMFYLEGLGAGTQVATIERESGSVRCRIDVPAGGNGPVTNVGDVTCEDAP